MYRLLALDLDGTILADDKSVPPCNREALKRAKAQGTAPVICTGRALPGLKTILQELGPEAVGRYHIGLNGGILYDSRDDKVVQVHRMEPEAVRRVLELGRARRGRVNLQLYTEDGIYTEKRCASTAVYERLSRCRLQEIQDLTVLADKVVKLILIFHESEGLKDYGTVNALARELATQLPPGTVGCCSCEYLYEVLSADCSKGTALEQLGKRLGISREETAALGDNENDAAMLAYAGMPATTANGTERIKDLCRYVSRLDNNQGGAADIIEKMILLHA